MLIPVPRASPERENKEGREEGRMKERGKKREGRHAVKMKAKPVTPAFQCLFRGWRRRKVGGLKNGGRPVSMCFPSVR